MITVAVTNRKGGVGKTMLSLSLASLLAGLGYKVVLIDTDPQGNIAKWFNMTEEAGVYSLLIKGEPISRLLREPASAMWWPQQTDGTLAILPGNHKTTTTGVALALNGESDDTLKMALDPLKHGSVDFVIIDTSPTVTTLMANVFVASDYALVPTAPEVLSINGVTKTMEDLSQKKIQAARAGIPLKVLGIVPNKMHRYAEHRAYLEELCNLFGEQVWSPVPYYVSFEKAPSFGKSIFAYGPRTKAAQAVRQLGYYFLKAMQAEGVLR